MSRYHSRVGVTSRLRMRGHDYTSPASYLITICTERRLCLFGTITSGEMVLSPAGAVVDSWWHYLPARVGSVELDAAVVMPNHFHAIVHLGTDPDLETAPSLSTVVRVFKRRTTYDYTVGVETEGWPRFPGRLWQEGFYDRIIRDEPGLERAREYVIGNPAKWADDEYQQPRSNLARSPGKQFRVYGYACRIKRPALPSLRADPSPRYATGYLSGILGPVSLRSAPRCRRRFGPPPTTHARGEQSMLTLHTRFAQS